MSRDVRFPTVALVSFALLAACRCTGGPPAASDAGDLGDVACDPAACTSDCRARGSACGRCLDLLGCRCAQGYYACDGDLPPADVPDADAIPECPSGSVPPPGAGVWAYPDPPLSEREPGDEWDFQPPSWDISEYRSEPVPGCERLVFPPFTDGGQGVDVEGDRVVSVQMATVCTDRGPEYRHSMFVVDLATSRMSLVDVAQGSLYAGVGGTMAFLPLGIAYTATTGVLDQFMVVADLSAHRKTVLRRWVQAAPFNDTGVTLSLHGSGTRLLAEIAVGSCCSNFEVYDVETRVWTALTDFPTGIRTFECDFWGERAVWDVWNNQGVMTATLSDRETVLIGYEGGYQWKPSIWRDRVCWGAGCTGPGTTIVDPSAGPCRIVCADLDEGVVWEASADLPPDERVLAGDIGPFVWGDWVAFTTVEGRDSRGHERLYHRGARRLLEFAPFGDLATTVPEVDGDHVLIYTIGSDGIPAGQYRCDLRVLFPEVYPVPASERAAVPAPVPGLDLSR